MNILIFLAFTFFTIRRLMTYLHIFQQEEYDASRYVHWVISRRAFDRKASLLLILASAIESFRIPAIPQFVASALTIVGLVVIAAREVNPTKAAKKKLVLTARARRIFGAAAVIILVAAGALAAMGVPLWAWIFALQAIPFALPLANLLLSPFENNLQRHLLDDAHQKLVRLRPVTIGITGSFGKTSVKHILGHVLSMHASTLITPGSVNTPMGIARVIREQLATHHKFFICEMGAYGIGSIERLCNLAPPDIAIVTAIGAAHYERFKSLEAVARAKFELYDAVAPRSGKTIIPSELLTFEYPSKVYAENPDHFVLIGNEDKASCAIISFNETAKGIETVVVWQGVTYTLKAPLHGAHHARNIALAFAAACTVGVSAEDAVLALTSVPQVKHRFEVKPQSNGVILIDDAYNSNPIGFADGLRSLRLFSQSGGRCVLVTPGMVELGSSHEEEHSKIGKLAAECVDILLPVAPKRIGALIDAYRRNRPLGQIVECDSFMDAQNWMSANLRTGDVVLLENDLPDLYDIKLCL